MKRISIIKACVATMLGCFLACQFALPVDAAKPAKKPAKAAKGAKKKAPQKAIADVPYPPKLKGGKEIATLSGPALLKPTETLHEDVTIAKTAPTVDVMYFPGQDYPGHPWSVWGDGMAKDGKYYTAIGDHLAPVGNALVYEYDSATKKIRTLFEVKKTIKTEEGHYRPGKIHSRMDIGADGRIYFATHRGSGRTTNDANHFKGDWLIGLDPKTAKAEIIEHAPIPKHCIPTSLLDPERMIFYGSTAPGSDAEEQDMVFFAYDLKNRKMLYSGTEGPSRAMMLAKSTGCLYYVPGVDGKNEGKLVKFDPAKGGSPVPMDVKLGLRAASDETPEGKIYVVSQASKGEDSILYEFDTKTEKVTELGPASVGKQTYITTLDVDPTGKYIYYMPGAHGGSELDGTPIVQYDIAKRKKKVIAFLHPMTEEKLGVTLKGTFGAALDPQGDKLYVTWNASRGSRVWDSAALSVIYIPESER